MNDSEPPMVSYYTSTIWRVVQYFSVGMIGNRRRLDYARRDKKPEDKAEKGKLFQRATGIEGFFQFLTWVEKIASKKILSGSPLENVKLRMINSK
jgi:hypothetical protein